MAPRSDARLPLPSPLAQVGALWVIASAVFSYSLCQVANECGAGRDWRCGDMGMGALAVSGIVVATLVVLDEWRCLASIGALFRRGRDG